MLLSFPGRPPLSTADGSSSGMYGCASALLTPTHARARGFVASSVRRSRKMNGDGAPAPIAITALRSGHADGRSSAPVSTGVNSNVAALGAFVGCKIDGSNRIVMLVPAVCDATLNG